MAADLPPVASTHPRDPERYRILGEHGRGGIGCVLRAHDRDLGRDIAIKELISRGHVGEVRFLREALITARLEHPGIVPIYEAGRWPDGTPFYAMKLVSGRSLRDLIAERTTVEDRIGLLHHVIAVADAIAYAHGHNIIHRDLKPANVIVGDFGETVVIDWGLAKDLGASEATVESGPFRSHRDDGLTSAGSVLGTPAYMAPEQERGEPVDQRADVFAIGAMLWELCTIHKLSPDGAAQRRHVLGRSDADPDLVTIITKALDPDPGRRYRDAGTLAADLKAFKSGTRITARNYSLLAMLAHWTRRHRALAVSVIAAILVAAAGAAVYVRGIAAERDRVAAANNALILEQAKLLLRTDPTAAFELLEGYRGEDTTQHAMLRAKAEGLGLARLHATPHSHGIHFVRHLADGTLVSASWDGTIAKTSPQGASRVIARGVAWRGASESARWLAYACDATAVCIIDLQTERTQRLPAEISAFAPVELALSPDGDLLAATSAGGALAVWRIADAGRPTRELDAQLERGLSLAFTDEHTLATHSRSGVHLFHLEASGRTAAAPRDFAISEVSDITASPELHLVAVTTTTGRVVILDSESDQIVRDLAVCKGYVNKVAVVTHGTAAVYACQDGDVGVWRLDQPSPTVATHVEGGVSMVTGSADGRYLIAGGSNGSLVIHDLESKMSRSYLGHSYRISALLPPSPEFPCVVSGDASGELRVWPLPDLTVRSVIQTASRMYRAFFVGPDEPVISYGGGPTLSWYDRAGHAGELPGHNPAHSMFARSRTRSHLVMAGDDDELELWALDREPALRTRKTGHGAASFLAYLPDGSHFVVGSRDGALVEWSDDDDAHRDLGSIHEPIAFLSVLPSTGSIVVGGVGGGLWLSGPTGLSRLGGQPGLINSIAASNDSRWMATASSEGVVRIYNTATREVATLQSPHPSSQYLLFTPDSRTLAIATDKTVSLMPAPGAGTGAAADGSVLPPWSWDKLDLAVHHASFSFDGMWFAAVCDQGGIWFNRRGHRDWIYLSTGPTVIAFGYFSADGSRFIATDVSGRGLMVDLRAAVFHRTD